MTALTAIAKNSWTVGLDPTFSRLSAASVLGSMCEDRASDSARGAIGIARVFLLGSDERRRGQDNCGNTGGALCRQKRLADLNEGGRMYLPKNVYGLLVSLRARLDREEGQALVEYALILALIAVVSIVVLQLMGINVSRVFGNVNNQLSAVGT